MIAFRGLTSALLNRNKLWILAIAAYMTVFSAVLTARGIDGIPAFPLGIGFVLAAFSYLGLLGIFVSPDADVASMKSSYPAHLFVLPVKSSQLAMVPMIYGTVITWPLSFIVIMATRHGGAAIDIYWLPMLFTAIVAMLQAIFWFPLGLPYSKLILTLMLVPGLATLLAIARAVWWDEPTVCWVLAGVIGLSYATAYVGVVKARRGDSKEIRVERADTSIVREYRPKPAFASAAQAQRWFEWRQNGLILPVISTIAFGLLCSMLFWNDTLNPIYSFRTESAQGVVTIPTVPTLLLVYYPTFLMLIPLAAWIIGCGAKRSAVKRGDQNLHLYYATRPLSNWALINAKLRITALSVLFTFGLLLVLSVPLLFVNGGYQTDYGRMDSGLAPLYQILAPHITWDMFGRLVAMLILLMFATWRNYVVGMWTEVSGKLWLRYAYPIGLILGISAWVAGLSYRQLPQVDRIYALPIAAVVTWIAVVIKLGLAAVLLSKHKARGLLQPRQIATGAMVYCVATAVVVGLMLYLTWPAKTQQPSDPDWETWFTVLSVGAVVLWIPIARILAAPLSLATNRHRP